MKAKILPTGATLVGLWNGNDTRSLVLGLQDPAEYQRLSFYAGAVVGPVANRIRGGRVVIDGKEHQMPRNENGETTLHSGPEGLHRRPWNVVEQAADRLVLRCHLPHGACGLPGERTFHAEYALQDNVLSLHLTATSDRTTLVNAVHHPYWAVDHRARLRVSAAQVLETNDKNLPTGTLVDVEGTPFDLRRPKPVPGHLDHCYVLASAPCLTPAAIARLEMPHYTLRIETTAPGLQVYAGKALPTLPLDDTLGWPITAHSGVALEPQLWPDAPNHDNFPAILLQAGEQFSQTTRYVIDQ